MRHHVPEWAGEASSNARRYYNTGSVSHSRWKLGSSRQQDEIALTENGGSIQGGSRIVKEVQWSVAEERVDGDVDHLSSEQDRKTAFL
jgi:hypothetical protein